MDAELFAVDGGEALHLADVGARHEGTACAGQNHYIDLVVSSHLIDDRVQIAEHLAVQRVQRLLPVNGHDANVALLFQSDKSHICVSSFLF